MLQSIIFQTVSVISEALANMTGLEIKSFNRSQIKLVTADGKEVKDMLGFAEADIT